MNLKRFLPVVWVWLGLCITGCVDFIDRDYGITNKQPVTAGEEIFHYNFDPLMSDDVHKFIDHIYIYEGIKENKLQVKYEYSEQYQGKTMTNTESMLLPLNDQRQAMLEVKPQIGRRV